MDPGSAERETQVAIHVPAKGDDAVLEPPRKKQWKSVASTSISALERLANADPCADVPMKRVPEIVREIMVRYASTSVGGEVPLTDMGSVVGPNPSRDQML